VSGCAGDSRDIHAQYYGDSHFTINWTEQFRFPTLQPSSKAKLSLKA